MYTVVSDDGNFPNYLEKEQIEIYNVKDFVNIASADEGIEIDEGIFVNILNMDINLIEGLEQYRDVGVNIKYFRTSNIVWPNCIPLEAIEDDSARIGAAFEKKIQEIL